MDAEMDEERTARINSPSERHNVLWFPDGNVVLATDSLLFRVHKSFLSLHSSVFKDMFDLPHVSAGDSGGSDGVQDMRNTTAMARDEYEGLPLVSLVGDKGEEVAHLLRAVYDRGCVLLHPILLCHRRCEFSFCFLRYYKCDDDETSLDVVTALLLLSTKYDFATIRGEVIKHIARHYPTTLEEHETRSIEGARLFGQTRRTCHFDILRAAFTAQADILLPSLYYASSAFTVRHILEQTHLLDVDCLNTLLVGKHSLEANVRVLTLVFLGEMGVKSSNCTSTNSGCKIDLDLTRNLGKIFISTDVNRFEGQKVSELCLGNFCPMCRQFAVGLINKSRKVFWCLIPKRFGFPDEWIS